MNRPTLAITQAGGNWGVTLAPGALQQKALIIQSSAQIQVVNDAMDAEFAVEAIRTVRDLIKDVEQTRKTVKAPVIALGKQIDQVASDYVRELEAEEKRVSALLNTYNDRERRAAEEAERKRQAELRAAEEAQRAAERARQKAEQDARDAAAKADRDRLLKAAEEARVAQAAVAAAAAEQAAAVVRPTPTTPKQSNTVVKQVVKFEVIDIAEVYRHNPRFVALTEKRAEINLALDAGMRQCPGLRIWEETQTIVR